MISARISLQKLVVIVISVSNTNWFINCLLWFLFLTLLARSQNYRRWNQTCRYLRIAYLSFTLIYLVSFHIFFIWLFEGLYLKVLVCFIQHLLIEFIIGVVFIPIAYVLFRIILRIDAWKITLLQSRDLRITLVTHVVITNSINLIWCCIWCW